MKQDLKEMILTAQKGDKSALETLVSSNMGLVRSIAVRFLGRGAEADDLFQIGSIGLIKAIKNFNTDFGVEFSTYAVPMIMGEIKRFLRDDGMIKVSRSAKETARKACAVAESIAQEKGEAASVLELAERMALPVEEVVFALEAAAPCESIYKTVREGDSSSMLLIDRLVASEGCEEEVLTRIALKEAVSELPARERKIITLRYFSQKTQREVAEMIGISQVQISRIEKKILLSLKEKIKEAAEI